MRKFSLVLILFVVMAVGCATVRVKAPKDPIKVDISMRLDVYQHVMKDIDAIEDIVSGGSADNGGADKRSFLRYFIGTAYAQSLSAPVEEAAMRRKGRYAELVSLESAGVIGENNAGLAVVRKGGNPSADRLSADENGDRMVIYKEIAMKNGTSVGDVQKVYAERLQKDAPAGTPIQSAGGSWSVK